MTADLITRLESADGWILASERAPTPKESAAFGGVECILQCTGSHNMQVMRFAKPVHIGGGGRVVWFDAAKGGECIENAAWVVTHWRPFPAFPDPIEAAALKARGV